MSMPPRRAYEPSYVQRVVTLVTHVLVLYCIFAGVLFSAYAMLRLFGKCF